MKYTVKKICEKIRYKKMTKILLLDKYMWNSTQEPKTYGWLGYWRIKVFCEDSM